ncbi:hypothetical protein KC953_01385 [Candidatus Saccharibacteria bacterium]|nr:hypothetical protein [Candidatus Saccharibacteria bacterium]
MPKKTLLKKATKSQRNGARRSLLEELFNDIYDDRRSIYRVNFFRGIFFGLGSVLGGTVVVALIVWTLSLFVQIPGIGDAAQKAQDTLETQKNRQ